MKLSRRQVLALASATAATAVVGSEAKASNSFFMGPYVVLQESSFWTCPFCKRMQGNSGPLPDTLNCFNGCPTVITELKDMISDMVRHTWKSSGLEEVVYDDHPELRLIGYYARDRVTGNKTRHWYIRGTDVMRTAKNLNDDQRLVLSRRQRNGQWTGIGGWSGPTGRKWFADWLNAEVCKLSWPQVNRLAYGWGD